jgi:serine protease Do
MLAKVTIGIRIGCLVTALAFVAPPLIEPVYAATADLSADLPARTAALLPSIADIRTTMSTPQGTMFMEGSGFVFDSSGLILTNRHVIAGAYKIMVTFPDMPPMPAKAVYISPRLDLAILKMDAGKPPPPLKLGDSDKVKVGDPIFLIGNALGLRTAVSTGVISAVNADIGDTMYDHYFQTDAALNHGNSGGPMFDMNNEVIAVNTALISSPNNTGSIGIGFSMPIDDAKFIVDQFVKAGHVNAGYVGVRAQRITDDLAEAFGLKSTQGAIVTEVDPKGPAAGKIINGDVILRVNDQDASDLPAVSRLIAVTPNDGVLQVRLRRGNQELTVPLTVVDVVVDERQAMGVLGHAPDELMAFATPSNPGMQFASITPEMRAKYGLKPDEQGVLVTEVAEQSSAAKRQIKAGEVIEKIGERSVSSPEDVHAALQAIADQHSGFAPLLVRGQEGPRWVPLPLDPGK